MRRNSRLVVGVVALIVALLLITSTGSFSAMTAERPAQVTVVDDPDAYLGVEQETEQADNGSTLNLTVTNQFSGGTDLDEMNVSVGGESQEMSLDAGESETKTFRINRLWRSDHD
ncbi:hypothetical protein ACFQH2_16605 [Natronoarchaeum sp. GCM10025703]|uniref:hypothetical protein n=1 Tax=Natronoarchaeum sp. GCM10025703 TaxID=3252685 RepID=UPI00361968B2